MFLNRQTMKSTENYSDKINKLCQILADADAILIGAGAGLSTSAGFAYDGERFEKYFSDFKQKYGITDMYSGGFYPFETLEEYWAWWSRHIYINRYKTPDTKLYSNLLNLVKNKDYFVITTNVDHQFQKYGFDKKRLFYTQGDYGLWQCKNACHSKTYDNKDIVFKMVGQQKNMKIPAKLIPKCPVCNSPMVMNLRCDDKFVQDDGWYTAADRYSDFIRRHNHGKTVFLELGVGNNTPAIIKYPFWQMTAKNKNSTYACINFGEAFCPDFIKDRSICINSDIGNVLNQLLIPKKNPVKD